jgi:putative transposase
MGADLSAGMHRLNGRYAQWFNQRHGFDGHLFQGRFSSKLVESDGHLLSSIRYVLRNPVEAGLCAVPEDWPWSSYSGTVGLAEPSSFVAVEELHERAILGVQSLSGFAEGKPHGLEVR